MSYAPLDLTHRVAVVIGGTSGIGRAIALGLAEAGADVVPSSRRSDQVEATANEVEQRGRRALRITSDVSDRASLEQLLRETVSKLGKDGQSSPTRNPCPLTCCCPCPGMAWRL